MREKRGGVWVPEDRLRATAIGGLVLAPLSVIASGVITQFANDGVWMMLMNFVCLFLNGAGVSVLYELCP